MPPVRLTSTHLLESHNADRPSPTVSGRTVAAEMMAGAVASLVTLAHCLSFSALIFSGNLASGLAMGLWGLLAATAAATLISSLTTTLPPVLAGPRNPAIAVMSVMATVIGADVIGAGGSGALAARHVLVALTLSTVLTGATLWLLGAFRLGQIVRFVPFPVIGGFLAASGWLLIVGGFKVATGKPLAMATLSDLGRTDVAKLSVVLAFAGVLQLLRRLGAGSAALPILFVSTAVVIDLALWWAGSRDGWFLGQATSAKPWSVLQPAMLDGLDWRVIARAHVEILSIIGVSVIALLLDISSLEVQRRASADMDREFRSGGAINLALAPFGGLSVGVALNPSRLVDELGGTTRLAGIGAGLALALVLASGVDIAAFVPTPLLAGLVVYLGVGVISEALLRSPAQRSVIEVGLAVAIMLAIVHFGYLTGVVLGLVGACITFAVRYSRIDAIRRHVTRADFAAPVERAPESRALLQREGGRIHVFWLTGFVFFGSSNRIYEEIRAKVGTAKSGQRRWVVLDLTGVTGIDSSAILSFDKLRNWAQTNNVALALAGGASVLGRDLPAAGRSTTTGAVHAFSDRTEALEWCEEGLIAQAHLAIPAVEADAFGRWLASELGLEASRQLMQQYLARREIKAGDSVCRQGEASDEIDLIAAGSVAVTFVDETGRNIRVRRMTGRTVIGEMGFFRGTARAASVVAIDDTLIYGITRERYDALLREDPTLGQALLEFVVRALADRVDFANREIAALI